MEDQNDKQYQPLWDGKEAENRPPRRPNLNNSNNKGETPEDPQDAVLRNSKLSVNAKEWFPPSNNFSAQHRLTAIKNTNVPETCDSDSNSDFQHLQEIIVNITYDPGQYEDIVDTFKDILNAYATSDEMVSNVADFIFQQAVNEASFRYNGARLCSVINENCTSFEDFLFKLCESEVEAATPKSGLTLFLAELYMQDPNYGNLLYTSIKRMLQGGGDDNVKTICQTLKLSGRSLETYNQQQMDFVFDKLEELKSQVKNNIASLVESVFTLRQKKWGVPSSIPSSSSSEYNNYENNWNPSIVEKPIFYGPDGMELSLDEQKFLATECGDNSYMEDTELDDPDELCDPEPEMDEEIQAAFREFVKLNK